MRRSREGGTRDKHPPPSSSTRMMMMPSSSPPTVSSYYPHHRSPLSPDCRNDEAAATEEIFMMLEMCRKLFRHPLHGHSYTRFTTLRPRVCHTCEGPIWGPFSHACHCLACGLVIHRQCAMQITKVPCGNYRGLFDPEGTHSAAAVAASKQHQPSAQSHVTAERKTEGSSSPSSPPSSSTPKAKSKDGDDIAANVNIKKEEDEERHKVDCVNSERSSFIASQGSVGDGSMMASPTTAATPRGSPTARRLTYDALAVVGALVGGFVGGPTGAFTAIKLGATTTGTFKAAGALAGAYTGYKRIGQGDGEGGEGVDSSSSIQSASHLPSSVAMYWSQLAHRIQEEGSRSSPFLDIQTFGKELSASAVRSIEGEASSSSSSSSAAVEKETGNSTPPPSRQDTNLLKEILFSRRTPPGYLWSRLLMHFRRRHPDYIIDLSPRDQQGQEGEEEEIDDDKATEGEMEKGGETCYQDAVAIVHEVALIMLDYVPGLLSSIETCDEAVETVEATIMTTLHPVTMHECEVEAEELCLTMKRWYEAIAEKEKEESKGEHHDDDGNGMSMATNIRKKKKDDSLRRARKIEKAAQELRAIVHEVTGLRKVRRILSTCLALGEDKLDMTADELLSLLGHTVKAAELSTLPAQLMFIDNMCDTGALLGAEGYALTSLQVVLSLILEKASSSGGNDKEDQGTSP